MFWKNFFFALTMTVVSCHDEVPWQRLFGSESAISPAETSSGNTRIVGGETSPKHYSYQVSLQKKVESVGFFSFLQEPQFNWSHFCGGSILNEKYIVTAAHCISENDTRIISALVGTKDLRKDSEGQRSLIESCVIHPDYVKLNNSDVAVCRLKTPLTFGINVTPIKLSKEYIGGGEECTLSGWGYTTMIRGIPSALPNELQHATLPTLTNEECNNCGHKVGPKEICTRSRFGQGACGGDSGGPLWCKGALTGIVSYGTTVCAISKPDVYTRASEFVDWIEQNSSD